MLQSDLAGMCHSMHVIGQHNVAVKVEPGSTFSLDDPMFFLLELSWHPCYVSRLASVFSTQG